MNSMILHNGDLVRRKNWDTFIDTIHGTKKNKYAILTILFNNTKNIQVIFDTLLQESEKSHFDLIIVDNSTVSQYENLTLPDDINIIYLRPTTNLGSSGGYAFGLERIIQEKYEYVTIIEDDIILMNDETFSETYRKRESNSIVFINPCFNTGGEHSWYVQYACYPVWFIEKVGIIDPRYFFRGDDLERLERIERGIKNFDIHKIIVDKNYSHPYLKKGNGAPWRIYFSIRNQLFRIEKYPTFKGIILFYIAIAFYILNGLIAVFETGNISILYAFWLGFSDFICNALGLKYSYHAIKVLNKGNKKLGFTDVGAIPLSKVNAMIKEYYLPFGHNVFSKIDLVRLEYSKNIVDYLCHGLLIGGQYSLQYGLTLGSPSVISIDEFSLDTDEVYISHKTNNAYSIKILSYLIYIPLTIIITTMFLIVISIKIIIVNIFRFFSRKGH